MKKKIVLFDIDYTLFDTDSFKKSRLKKHNTFSEVLSVLKELSNIVTLGIFSEGANDFQRKKLTKTKIKKYFPDEHIHIFDKKDLSLTNIINKYKNQKIFLVDDKLSILYKAKEISPDIVTIWVKRGRYAAQQVSIEGFTPSAIIENLNEVIPLVLLK